MPNKGPNSVSYSRHVRPESSDRAARPRPLDARAAHRPRAPPCSRGPGPTGAPVRTRGPRPGTCVQRRPVEREHSREQRDNGCAGDRSPDPRRRGHAYEGPSRSYLAGRPGLQASRDPQPWANFRPSARPAPPPEPTSPGELPGSGRQLRRRRKSVPARFSRGFDFPSLPLGPLQFCWRVDCGVEARLDG